MNAIKMKAIITTRYGSPEVLALKEIAKPVPKDKEVLVKVQVASITAADSMMRKGSPYIGRLFIGLTKPKKAVPGVGFAGEIEAVGAKIKDFYIGDQVFGETLFGMGTHAEYICISEEDLLLTKPESLTFEEAAPLCDGALTSLSFLKDLANIQPGQKVLINGASGSLGTAAVQLAKHYGAEVTGVCGPANQELVKSLGADRVLDYTKEDFTKSGESYDIIYDTVGKLSFSKCKLALNSNGLFLSPVLSMSLLFQVIKTSLLGGKKAIFSATGVRPITDLRPLLQEIKELMANGKLKSIIDRRYSLSQIVEAHTYVDQGHKKGNVVLQINPPQ